MYITYMPQNTEIDIDNMNGIRVKSNNRYEIKFSPTVNLMADIFFIRNTFIFTISLLFIFILLKNFILVNIQEA